MKISVITVVYNNARTLGETIHSVGKQTYTNREYIIVDGGSTDGTLDIVQNNIDMIDKWISEPDQGIYDAMNKGIKMATGDVLVFLNSDDIFAGPNILELAVAKLEDTQCDAVMGHVIFVNAEMKIRRFWRPGAYFNRAFLWGWMPPHQTFFARKILYDQYGGFRSDVIRISGDYEIMLRFIHKHKATISYIPQLLAVMRLGGESTSKSLKNKKIMIIEDKKSWKINKIKPYLFTLYFKYFRTLIQFPRAWGHGYYKSWLQ